MYQTTLHIEGMSCSMCEAHLNDVIRRAFLSKKVQSNHHSGTLTFLSETVPDEKAIHEVIDPTGYKLLCVKTEPYEKKRFSFFKK